MAMPAARGAAVTAAAARCLTSPGTTASAAGVLPASACSLLQAGGRRGAGTSSGDSGDEGGGPPYPRQPPGPPPDPPGAFATVGAMGAGALGAAAVAAAGVAAVFQLAGAVARGAGKGKGLQQEDGEGGGEKV